MKKENSINLDSFFDYIFNNTIIKCRIYEENGLDYSLDFEGEKYSIKAVCIEFDKEFDGNNSVYFDKSIFEDIIDADLFNKINLDKTEYIRQENEKIFLKTLIIIPKNNIVVGEVCFTLNYVGGFNSFSIDPITFKRFV